MLLLFEVCKSQHVCCRGQTPCMMIWMVLLSLFCVMNFSEAIPAPDRCPPPFQFYEDGNEPVVFCCKACIPQCKCAYSKDYPWNEGGKCWAKCNCGMENCEAI